MNVKYCIVIWIKYFIRFVDIGGIDDHHYLNFFS